MNIRERSVLSELAIVLVVQFSMLGSQAQAGEDEPLFGPNDFAFGRSLIAERPGSLQSVLLDFDVYRRSVEPGLADLRVFDGDGQPLPYAIRRRLPGTKATSRFVRVPIFRLDAKPDRSISIGATTNASDYRIDAELTDSGAVVSIHRGDERGTDAGPPAGWLLDASGLDGAVVKLDFTFAEGGGDFVSRLRLESSGDLARWRPVDTQLALARLEQNGHRIERTSFDIPKTKARYLRVTPIAAAPPVELNEVRAELARKKPSRRRFSQRLDGRVDPDDPSVVLFDLGASPPIETVQVRLDQMNSIVEGRLESATQPEGPWRVRQRGVFYRFNRGGELRNPKASWNASRDRYLRFVTSSRGGGLQGETPTLEVVWQPEQLLYLERDAGGSMLAIGRAGTPDGSFDASDLLRMGKSAADDHTQVSVRLGPEMTLAGRSVLELETPPPWRTYGLWALLLAIVGTVLALSFRLMRSADD
jgi:hypothetical protein